MPLKYTKGDTHDKIYKSEDKITMPSFNMRTNKETWDPGDYKIELYLNGTLDETIEFKVEN